MSTVEPSTEHYDLIVIGAGPVGENVADYASRSGARAAVVEAELVGGECSYWACMPSKALLRSGHALRAARRVPGAREAAAGRLDVDAVLARRTSFTSDWEDDGQVEWLESVGVDLIRGRARLTGPSEIDVDGRRFTARAVALATGSTPVVPDIPGLAEVGAWGTREATSADRIPPRLVVVGGGVAGTELAFAFASLGSRVTLVARSGVLTSEEPFVGELVAASLEQLGAEVRIGSSPAHVERDDDGIVTVELDDGETLRAEELLVATGRRPRTDGLGLEELGLPSVPDVDDTMLVKGTDWLYAVGDVNGRAPLTHQGKYQARAAGGAIAARLAGEPVDDGEWGRHVASADHAAVPHVVFSDPEVASVGLTEAAARDAGVEVDVVEQDLGAIAGAVLHADDYRGRAKVVIDRARRIVIGATFVGQDTADLVHAATIAIVGEVAIDRLRHAVPSYPTISEVWLRLLEAYD